MTLVRDRDREGYGAIGLTRRAFVLAGALLVASAAAEAQPAKVHRVGVLLHDGAPPGLLETFRAELYELGYVEGKTLGVEMRNAAGRTDRLSAMAEELVRSKVDVILAVNTPAAQAAKKATTTIPIVIARVTDPVKSGLVASLARPGGNVTGLSFNNAEVASKGLQILKQAMPGISRVGVLSNADNPAHTPQIATLERGSSQLGLEVVSLSVRVPGTFAEAFHAAARARIQALFVLDDTAVTKRRREILKLAAAHALPVVTRYKDFAEAGALIAYGPNLPAVYRRAAHYVDRILKGAQPSELPLEEPSQFDLVINLKTAKALGLTVPASVLLTASQIIE